MKQIVINDRVIGAGQPVFIIAEVAQAHDGSLGMAHSYIDAAAEAGADAIKFQTHIASSESTKDETFRIPMSGQDSTRYEYWNRMEFTVEQWRALHDHAVEKGLVFLSSAFSVDAVKLLADMDMGAWKVGSGEFKSTELLQAMIETKKPILYSTGMSTYDEVGNAIDQFNSMGASYAVFQCTSLYPTPLEAVGLNVLEEYQTSFGCPVGLSDHSGSIFPSLFAIAKGVSLLEVHVTFDKRMYGPDTIASLTFEDLNLVCRARDTHYLMEQNPVNKDEMACDLKDMRKMFTKSIALKDDLPKGTLLEDKMLVPKKPGTGIPYTDKGSLLGKVLVNDVSRERLLTWEDISNEA